MDTLKKVLEVVKGLWLKRKWTTVGLLAVAALGGGVLVYDAVANESSVLNELPALSCEASEAAKE